MAAPTLTPDALELYRLIHRAGEHAYLWGKTCDKGSNGTTRWFRPGETPAVFNSNHNNYHGVHPTTKAGTQYQRAKKGEVGSRSTGIRFCDYGASLLLSELYS